MTEWISAYEFFWDSNRKEAPYDPDDPDKWDDHLLWRMNPGKQTTIMMFRERDRINRQANRLLDKRPCRDESLRKFTGLFMLTESVKENANLRYYSRNCFRTYSSMEPWTKLSNGVNHRTGKTKVLILKPKEVAYLRWAQPTLFTPRGLHKTDIRIPLERRILTDLALQNWW